LVVPPNIPADNKLLAYKLINYLLSDDQQSRLVSTMWQYNSTMINDKVPGIVWEQIPKIEVAKKAAIPPERVNADAIAYIKKNAVNIIPK
jgi:ABC-type thiamine transport system substrate-binding protein